MKNLKKSQKIVLDILLNMVATALPLIILQFAILPFMAKQLKGDDYGLLLAVVSLVTIISNTLGNSLNNVRLLNDLVYKKNHYTGDFQILLFLEISVNILCVFLGLLSMQKGMSGFNLFWILLFASLTVAREYYIVNYRLKLDYWGIVWNNMFTAVGYLIGYLIFKYSGFWIMPYLLGAIISLLHVIYKNDLVSESVNRTPLFKNSFYKTFVLFIAGILSNTLTYADRLLIYPMIGGTAVAIYFSSSFLGKIVTTGITPVASVILSYIAKKEYVPRKQLRYLMLITGLIGIVGYMVGILISPPLLSILYPQWVEEACKYVRLTTLTAMIIMFTNVIKPFALRYCNINWQIMVNLIPFIVYFMSAILLYRLWGLYGFCLGVLLSNVVKCMIYLGIVSWEIKIKERDLADD